MSTRQLKIVERSIVISASIALCAVISLTVVALIS